MQASYADESALAPGTSPTIGTSIITVPTASNGQATKVKVKVRLDVNGILSVDSAQSVEEIEVDEPAKAEPAKANGGDAPMTDAPAGNGPPAGEGAETPAAEPEGQPAAEEVPKPEEPVQVCFVRARMRGGVFLFGLLGRGKSSVSCL